MNFLAHILLLSAVVPYCIRIFKYRSYNIKDKIKLLKGIPIKSIFEKFSGGLGVTKPFLIRIQCVSANPVSEIDIFPDAFACSLPLWVRH